MKRVGRFWVSAALIDDNSAGVAQVLSLLEFIPTGVEYNTGREAFLYRGISPKFREVRTGDFIPEYRIMVQERAPLLSDEGDSRAVVSVDVIELGALPIGPVTAEERAELLTGLNKYFKTAEGSS